VFERHAGDADVASVWLLGAARQRALAQARWDGALPPAQVATLARWAEGCAALCEGACAPSETPAAAAVAGELSERELEVLERIAAGDSNKLIARALDLSPHTVKRHVANILDKLDLRSRGQAAAWYHDHVAAA
jgi:LuxR family maltose regulon positive regulatory protein